MIIIEATSKTIEAMEQSTAIVYTYDDFLTLPNDGKRYEIIEGELYMTPAPNTNRFLLSYRAFFIHLQHNTIL